MSNQKAITLFVGVAIISFVVIALAFWKTIEPMVLWHRADFLAQDVVAYYEKHGVLPSDVDSFCLEFAGKNRIGDGRNVHGSIQFLAQNFEICNVDPRDVLHGSEYIRCRRPAYADMANIVNERIRCYLGRIESDTAKVSCSKQRLDSCHVNSTLRDVADYSMSCVTSKVLKSDLSVLSQSGFEMPCQCGGMRNSSMVLSDKNQVMDALLGQSQIPADYGETMIALFRDPAQDVVTRDFAVQHIGLYAQALNRRGVYDPDSADAANCRNALFDAASETSTIVAAAAFRALADVSEFDSRIDARRLDNMLIRCATDESSSLAARVMAVQLCGERNVRHSTSAIKAILGGKSVPEPLRRAAFHSLKLLEGISL